MNELRRKIAAAATGPAAPDGPGATSRRYRFAPDFPGFAGHFPGDPVLPAVVQLLAAVCLAEDGEGRRLRLAGVGTAKFLFPIRPDEEILVRCRVRADGDERLCDAVVSAGGRPAAVAQLRLADERENG